MTAQQALPLLEGANASAFIMDKAYDSKVIREQLSAINALAVIPPRSWLSWIGGGES